MTPKELRIKARSDQAWASIAEYLSDISRIARQGLDGSERDALLARQVCCIVAGHLLVKRHEMSKLEGNGEQTDE